MKDFEIELAEKEKKYLETARAVREKNFNEGNPFLMLSDDLPEGESYWDYPDGRIEIQRVVVVGNKIEYIVVKELGKDEANKVRGEHGL